jgi:hypothetical protein
MLSVGQSTYGGKLRWYESVNCSVCGLRSEADGAGMPPAEIRQRLIERHGLWSVWLHELKSGAATGKVLRNALGMDVRQLALLLKQLPGVAYTGTKGESTWLIELLRAAGESPVLEEATGGGHGVRA